jgi:hypothetical protein
MIFVDGGWWMVDGESWLRCARSRQLSGIERSAPAEEPRSTTHYPLSTDIDDE